MVKITEQNSGKPRGRGRPKKPITRGIQTEKTGKNLANMKSSILHEVIITLKFVNSLFFASISATKSSF